MTLPPAERDFGPPFARARLPDVNVFIIMAIIAALWLAREVLVPLALALLLSFVLSPAVTLLQRARAPRPVAVGVVVIVAVSALAGFGWFVATQVSGLAANLPGYQSTLRDKIRSVRGATAGGETLERASIVLNDLRKEIDRPSGRDEGAPGAPRPVPVEVRNPENGPLQSLLAMISPLIHPLTNTFLVILFAVFILAQREDLRNRLIVLGGTRDIQRTTAALDDAGARLGRLFIAQLGLNFAFGLAIAAGLTAIGVPSAPLWGVLAMIMRFLPYVGALISAVFPLVLAAAVGDGWTMAVLTGMLFLIAEPLFGHFLEPLLLGRSTGLSPLAIVVSATFWTWIWGPVGLVLATPLTVCLVVVGRHIEFLGFLEVMLGDESPLSPPELVYQRLLAKDPVEIGEQARAYLRESAVVQYYDEILLPALALARRDDDLGRLDDDKKSSLLASVKLALDDIHTLEGPAGDASGPDHSGETGLRKIAVAGDAGAPTVMPGVLRARDAILCTGGRGALDDCASAILAARLGALGGGVALETSDMLAIDRFLERDIGSHRLLCVCFLGAPRSSRIRYIARRVRRKAPATPILICVLGEEADVVPRDIDEAGVHVAGSLAAAVAFILEQSHARPDAGMEPDVVAPA